MLLNLCDNNNLLFKFVYSPNLYQPISLRALVYRNTITECSLYRLVHYVRVFDVFNFVEYKVYYYIIYVHLLCHLFQILNFSFERIKFTTDVSSLTYKRPLYLHVFQMYLIL